MTFRVGRRAPVRGRGASKGQVGRYSDGIKLLVALTLLGMPALGVTQRSDASFPSPREGSKLVSKTLLAEAFHAKGSWEFQVWQDPDLMHDGSAPPSDGHGEMPGNLHLCFVQNGVPDCVDSEANEFVSATVSSVVGASRDPHFVVVIGYRGWGSGHGRGTLIWEYNPREDRFDKIFDGGASLNMNEEVRIVESGPLSGTIVTVRAPQHRPFRYGISVHRLEGSRFVEILKYDGKSKYNDGNPMPVIDAEMVEIERRLGLWKPGDPLPTPVRTACAHLTMKHGIEWCE